MSETAELTPYDQWCDSMRHVVGLLRQPGENLTVQAIPDMDGVMLTLASRNPTWHSCEVVTRTAGSGRIGDALARLRWNHKRWLRTSALENN